MMSKDDLFTARWHLLNGEPIPEGGPTESLLDLLRPQLGPEPVWYDSSVVEDPTDPVDPAIDDLPPISDVPWLIGPGGAFPIVGKRFSPEEFGRYLQGIPDEQMSWIPGNLTMHHTASPSLAQRPAPQALTEQHMRNLRSWYHDRLGWSRGPHLFVDDNGIWVFSPITNRGVHAVSFNSSRIGIEMLGNFDVEDPYSGRGLEVTRMSVAAAAALCDRFRFDPGQINGHRDDPRTSKTCPGRLFDLARFRSAVSDLLSTSPTD